MSDAYSSMIEGHIRLAITKQQTEDAWLRDCNKKGLEVYQDWDNAVRRNVACDCDEDCGEPHTILVAPWKTRPCPNHFKGHMCNPVDVKITGLGS